MTAGEGELSESPSPLVTLPPIGTTDLPEFVNRPDRFGALGWRAFVEAFAELLRGREILWRLIKRDIAGRYRQSLLGLGWALLTPLALVLVFLYLRRARLIDPGNELVVPHALFLYAGFLPWQLFQACLSRTCQSLVASANLVNRVRFPREILVLAAVGGALFDFAVGLVLLLGFFAWFGFMPVWTALLLPLLVLVQVAFSLAIGLVISIVNGALRDLGSIVQLLGLLWMLLTPVVYVAPTEGPGAWLLWLNPMAPIITAYRDLLFAGTISHPAPLALATGLSLVLLPLAWRFFHVALPRVAETI
ncbi:MAG: ABC transporter permease [Planctomycetota bacterium]